MSNFSELFNDLIEDKNISVKDLSKLIDIQDSLLYKYLNGVTVPTTKNLIKIANYFDCSINYLVGLSDVPKSFKFSNKFDINFFERYNKLLAEHGKKHYSLKDELNLSMSSLTNWENGQIPYLDTLIKIAKYFDVSIDYLVGRSDEK